LNTLDIDGPMHYAVENEQVGAVEWLLQHGTKCNKGAHKKRKNENEISKI
jgi:hypothetical protein